MKKKRDFWEDIGMKPPPAKKTTASPRQADPNQLQAQQEQLRANAVKTFLAALSQEGPGPTHGAASTEEVGDGGDAQGDAGPSTGSQQADTDAKGLAERIEQALFVRQGSSTGQEYKNAARTLLAALKRNSELRQRVLRGSLPPGALVALDPRDLATRSQQQENARLQELEAKRVTLSGHGAVVLTTEYTCGRCGGRECDYLDSGRRDIGKCETWGSKDGQGSSRLVRCMGCGHRWEVDDV